MKTVLRSTFVRSCLLLAAISSGFRAFAAPDSSDSDAQWKQMDEILQRIVAPSFPAKDFPLVEFGAVGDGKTDCHPAFVKAIEACHEAGGGRVVVPAGEFLTNGPIHLKSNVELHVSEGATIKFGTEPKDYLPVVLTRWEGVLLYNYSPLIYAYKQTNVAITGKGTIDGNGRAGFGKFTKTQGKDRAGLWKMGGEQVPLEERVFGEGHSLRPSAVQPFECTNVLIEGITIKDVPFWVVHPVLSKNVTVRGITVNSTLGNNDGCDPDSCTDVLIEDCHFHTGDDAIAIKSGRDQDGWKVGRPSENIVVRRITSDNKLYALCIGSEMSGNVRNVFMHDCRAINGRAAVYAKSNMDRGGIIENVFVRRVEAENMTEGVVRFETGYHGHRGGNYPPTFRNFVIEDVHCLKSKAYGIYAEGVETSAIRDVVLRRVTIDECKSPLWLKYVEGIRFDTVKVNGTMLPENPPLTAVAEEKLKIRD